MEVELLLLMQSIANKAYLSVDDLMIQTKVSKRQIMYRLDKINQILKTSNQLTIQLSSNGELVITPDIRSAIELILHTQQQVQPYYLNKEERQNYLFLMMFLNFEYLSLQHFINSLQLSRSTVLQTLKTLSDELTNYSIVVKNDRISGYYLEGDEGDIRRYMIEIVLSTLSKEPSGRIFDLFIDEFHLDIFQYSKLVIDELANQHNIHFVEDHLNEFIYIFIFLKMRILNSSHENEEPLVHIQPAILQSLKEYKFTVELLKNYKNTENIPKADIYYISSWILGISVGDINEDTKDWTLVSELVMKVLMRFESLSGVHFKDTEKIFTQLYGHIRPAYYRMIMKLPIYNPLSERIQDEFPELYKLVKESMRSVAFLFPQETPDEEIAYLTMHFATIFSNHRMLENNKQKTALVVCGNGIGSSAILYNELKNLFPELHFLPPINVGKLQTMKDQADIVFATSYILNDVDLDIPIVRVSPVMNTRERYQVVRELYALFGNTFTNRPNIDVVMNIIRKYADVKEEQDLYSDLASYFTDFSFQVLNEEKKSLQLIDLLNPRYIHLEMEAENREDAIRQGFLEMKVDGIVSEEYIETIIRDMRRLGPYFVITKHFVLPHALPEAGAYGTAIGISVLKEPIKFGSAENDPVKYIFSLSSTNSELHLQAMNELIDLMADQKFYEMLDCAKQPQEIIQYIYEHTKDK